MDNPYQAPKIDEQQPPRGFFVAGSILSLLSLLCFGVLVVTFGNDVLIAFGYFPNTYLNAPLWKVALEKSPLLVIGIAAALTSRAFFIGKLKNALMFGCITLVLFAVFSGLLG